MYCMYEKGPQKPPEHASEHVKFPCPPTILLAALALEEFFGCMLAVEMPGMKPNRSLKRVANVTKKKLLNELSRKPIW